MSSIYSAIPGRLAKRGRLALATIIETDGSAPQVPGASALFSTRGLIQGTLGGGVLEAEAGRRAAAAIRSGRSSCFRFDLRGAVLEEEEPVCGGEAAVLVDASPAAGLDSFLKMRESLRSRRRGVLAAWVRPGPSGDVEIRRRWIEEGAPDGPAAEGGFPVRAEDVAAALAGNRPALSSPAGGGCEAEGFIFLEPLAPLPRLLVVGAGHVGQAVSRLAAPLGFEITVIDDRAEFASARRFPDADRVIIDTPGRALREFPVGGDTYIVIVTRGHRDDAEALRACVRSEAAYVGLIGSRGKISLMREKFLAEGWASEAEFDRVRAPIGLPIGSRTVEEIAVSIAAELVQVRSLWLAKSRRGGK